MLNALIWGLIATSSLILGGLTGIWRTPGRRALGAIMGFGAGALISAVAYELIYEAVRTAKGSGYPAIGFLIGATGFFLSDKLLTQFGARDHKTGKGGSGSGLVIPMILAIILDGIPESMVIGLGILEQGSVSFAMLAAVFISNLPESIAATSGMKANGRNGRQIVMLWAIITFICALATLAGFSLLEGVSIEWMSFIHAFAGGAILMMLANSMMPEAYEHGGKLAGIFTVLGFGFSVVIVILERMAL
jgi:ZIP family zinc transporter